MARFLLLAAAVVNVANAGFVQDYARATMKKPRATSGLLSDTVHGVFSSINDFMTKGGYKVAPCEDFTVKELVAVGEALWGLRDEKLGRVYRGTDGRRYIALAEREGAEADVVRDGLCAQVLMIWAHHVPTDLRKHINMTIPLMPAEGPRETSDHVYRSQVSCTECHYAKVDETPINANPSTTLPQDDTYPPRWGGNNQTRQYSVLVNMTDISDSPDHPYWQFRYYYDDELKSSRYEHLEGQDDEVCRGATPILEPCTVIFATNGLTYVQSNTTCCIRNYGTWGAVRSDWLQNGGASYIGRSTINNYTVDGWLKQGASDNHYYAMANGYRTPVRYMEHKNGILKQWDFNVPTWKPGPQPRTLFEAPASCDKPCP